MPWHQDMEELESRFRKRLLTVYIVVVIMLMVIVGWTTRADRIRDETFNEFRNAIVEVCLANRDSDQNYNNLIDTLIRSVQENDSLAAAEKKHRIGLYSSGKAELATCPPPYVDQPR